MRKIILLLAVLGSFLSCDFQDNNYELKGEGFNEFDGYQIYLYHPESTPVRKLDTLSITVIVNGTFLTKGNIDFPYRAIFSIKKEGKTRTKGYFLLEKGKLNLKYVDHDVIISGGKYNDIVVNSWKKSDAYLSKFNINQNLLTAKKEERDYDKLATIYREMRKIKQAGLDEIALNHKDPIARLLALDQGAIKDLTKKLELIDALKDIAGDNKTWKNLKYNIQDRKESRARRNEVTVGKTIKDFTAQDLEGNEFHLADILKKNKYVLVEFWASWCGPCRQEIPHMKKAYEKFHSKGFEIISFTIDEKKEKWVKASEKEKIPWLNTGDLKGHSSPIAKMYGISGVPANFLVSADGKIVAKDLRQKDLDKKLTDLFK